MKTKTFELPVKASGSAEAPAVTSLEIQHDGTLLAGFSFAHPLLAQLAVDGDTLTFNDLRVEEGVHDGYAIVRGLRGNTIGDTAFAVLVPGFLPEFVRKLAGGDLAAKSGTGLLDFLRLQSGGIGTHLRHDVVQIIEGELRIRRSKEAGALLDCAHIGDFVFGLNESAIWREPYLNTEKRETLRSDLDANSHIHRDAVGIFWFLGENGRLLRMGLTDIKAKPTPLKLPKPGFRLSTASTVDGWLYGVCGSAPSDAKTLFRLRMNPVSFEEEMQVIATLPDPITALVAVEREEKPFLLLACQTSGGPELWDLELIRPEDPELLPAIPAPRQRSKVEGIGEIGTLTADLRDPKTPIVYGGEGYLGWGKTGTAHPRVIRFTDFE